MNCGGGREEGREGGNSTGLQQCKNAGLKANNRSLAPLVDERDEAEAAPHGRIAAGAVALLLGCECKRCIAVGAEFVELW